ncbi:MAG: hypothetical protein ACQGVC_10105 [Myxococcota bacterium]
MKRALASLAVLAATLLPGASPAGAAPTADLHDIKWFVHVDMVGGAMDLPFYEAILDEALADARLALEGSQGPADVVCCNQLQKEEHSPGVTLATFGTTGDGLDIQDAGDLNVIRTLGGSGTRGFLIDSINDCSGSAAIGCADLPACGGPPDDDPDRVLVVTMDAYDSGVLGFVIAHERGHNACLVHVTNDPCELMRATVGGGCVSTSECSSLTDARQSTGGSCACHADSPANTAADDGDACTDGAVSGVCSGGLCGESDGSAGTRLLAAGGPGANTGNPTDDPLLVSGLTGGWSDVGSFGDSIVGLAYDADTDTHYAIRDGVGDDIVAVVDPDTGTLSASQTVTGHPDIIALAFDPGASSGAGDDRLLALSTFGGFEDLIQIDPTTGAASTLGSMSIGVTDGFQGMAYDDVNDQLYIAGFGSSTLYSVDEGTCTPPPFTSFCGVSAVGPTSTLWRMEPALAFSRDTEELYLVGHQIGDQFFYERIDAASYERRTQIGPDHFTVGGLAPVPLPEPAAAAGLAAGASLLGWLSRRRARRAG